ncbi:MAG: response regulator [Gammaproteobacteria bacterium]
MTATAGNLLIVDDETSVRQALRRLLRKEGYAIFDASGAEDTMRILNQDPIDVILSDQDMPGTSGIELLVDAAKKYPNQHRLMISGRFQSREVAEAMDAGAIHKFMMKPWDDAILKADIRPSFRQIMTTHNDRSGGEAIGDAREGVSSTSEQEVFWVRYAEDRRLSRELHNATRNGSLSMVYQPQICLQEEKVCGFEARLARTLGADVAQRYFFSKPRPSNDVRRWVANGCVGLVQ